MNCKEIDKLLAAYFDGEVIPEEREQIQAHLSACPHCREKLEALAATQSQLREALKVTAAGVGPSPQAWVSLRQRLEAERQSPGTVSSPAKSKVSRGIDTIVRGLVSRQPIWKSVIAGVLAMALITGLVVTLPSLTKQSPEALAASIARNSPEVQAALDGEEIEEVEVTTKVVDDEGNVLLVLVKTETRAVAAEVNLETKEVTEVIRVHVPEFKAGDEQKAIDIAKANPRVQELLAQGAVVGKVNLVHSINIEKVTSPDGVTRKEGSVKLIATVFIDLKGKVWHATVDLDDEKLLGLAKPSVGTFIASMSHLIFSIITPFVVAIGVLIILGLALRNRLARAIAGIASIVLGIIGLFGGLYVQLPTAWNQALLFGIPIIGLVIGIVEIRRRATKRWMAIAGVVICSIALVWDLVSLIAYPDRQSGVIIAIVLVLIGIITYAFYDRIKKTSWKWLRPALVAGAAVIVLAILLVTQPWGLSPQSVMAKVYAATTELQSYRMFSFIKSTLEGKTLEATFETEFVAPDRHRGKATTNGDWVEFIIIGDKQYIRDSDPSRTTSVGVSSSSILSKEDTLKIIDSLTDLEKLPDEKIDGVDYIHYRGMVDVDRVIEEQKAKLDPRQPHYEEMLKGLEDMRNMKTEVELWIGKEDYLIRQMKQDMEVPLEGTSRVTVKYYDFNELITIEPPTTASGELLPGWQLQSSPQNQQERTFSSDVSFTIGGDDLTHQQISFRITITNISDEVASNLRVSLASMATNDEDGWMIWNSPSQVTLKPGESETYHISWEYDASQTSKEELDRLVGLTTILATYTTPEGSQPVELLFPDAPYPSKTPPKSPPG